MWCDKKQFSKQNANRFRLVPSFMIKIYRHSRIALNYIFFFTSFHSRLQIYANNFGHFVLLLRSSLKVKKIYNKKKSNEDSLLLLLLLFLFCFSPPRLFLITIDDNHKKLSTKHKMQKFIIIIFSWFNEILDWRHFDCW